MASEMVAASLSGAEGAPYLKETSDPALLSEVRKYGIFNVRGCFNCGSCTIVCDLATGPASFPRRTVQSVVLGLSDYVLQSLEPWLCHDCGDCSTICPREAQPQESMMTLRRYLTAQYDWTGLSSRIYRSPAWGIALHSFVAVLVLVLLVLHHLYVVQLPLSDLTSTSMGLEHMFDKITYFTWAVFFLPAFFILCHAFRMYLLTMRRNSSLAIPLKFYVAEAKLMFLHMLIHLNILKCPDKIHQKRWIKHWLLAFGCVLMSVILIFFLKWFQTDQIYPAYHPQRWLGYLTAVFLIYGSLDILIGRIRKRNQLFRYSEWSDLILPALLFLTGLSGMAVHIFRYLGLALATHYTYAVHLMISVPMLVVEVPFGKWSHMIYRPMAIYFAAVKARALQAQTPAEVKVA